MKELLEEIFKVEDSEDFTIKVNLVDVNKEVIRFIPMLAEHKKAIQHVLNMQIIAATSHLYLKTLSQLEERLRRIAWRLPGTLLVRGKGLLSVCHLSLSVNGEEAIIEVEVELLVSIMEEGRVRQFVNQPSTRACFKCGDGHLIAQFPE